MAENLAVRWMRRYKVFFLMGLLILSVQIFLAYKSLVISDLSALHKQEELHSGNIVSSESAKQQSKKRGIAAIGDQNSVADDEDLPPNATKERREAHLQQQQGTRKEQRRNVNHTRSLTPQQLGFQPECEIVGREAISALQRAKTKDCRKHIADVACAIKAGRFYATNLPNQCPTGNHTANAPLGCYRDDKKYRLLSGYFINLKAANTPRACIQLCLQSGFPYAGVQYGTECFCGTDMPEDAVKLADSSCNMKCSGDSKDICGGYYSINVYETGIAKFVPRVAETSAKAGVERAKIAFLLTLNGRALRQVHRLIRALYSAENIYYIHVDARQDYLYRELLELQKTFPNIRLAPKRFSTIWGGASLLSMLMQCMTDLLASPWHWDFVINLSESDFPVKTTDKLVNFLTANHMRNFVKSHGRETQRFIQKQGLDKTFVECEQHMWRIGDRSLPNGIQLDGGSDWVALSRPFVEYVTKQAQQDPLLVGLLVVFRHTLLPAESFFHTVLRNSKFCHTYIDNNLHVTNWKRKLGCKCQYKHVVDWCGCSPNDFKPEDWNRLQGTDNKMLFFARKFEPIINQAIILQLEEWLFGPYTSEYMNLHAYWQSFYHIADKPPSSNDDVVLTVAESAIRRIRRHVNLAPQCIVQELTHYMMHDEYKGFLVRFRGQVEGNNQTMEFEMRLKPMQYMKVAKNSKFAKRLRNFEVSSDFDLKEQVSRNFAKILGPHTEVVLSFTVLGRTAPSAPNNADVSLGAGAGAGVGGGNHRADDTAHTYNLTVLWIDPLGQLQDFTELHIEDTTADAINFSKAILKAPVTPGIWTVKLIGRAGIYAQTKFLIVPLARDAGQPITLQRSRVVNGGMGVTISAELVLPAEWLAHLPTANESHALQLMAKANVERSGRDFTDWIDELLEKFFHIRELCAVTEAGMSLQTSALNALPLCRETIWSSLAPDPKSDVSALLKR